MIADGDRVIVSGTVTYFTGAGVAEGTVSHRIIDSTGRERLCVEFGTGQWYYFAPDELVPA